jgi:hypothetical protein
MTIEHHAVLWIRDLVLYTPRSGIRDAFIPDPTYICMTKYTKYKNRLDPGTGASTPPDISWFRDKTSRIRKLGMK